MTNESCYSRFSHQASEIAQNMSHTPVLLFLGLRSAWQWVRGEGKSELLQVYGNNTVACVYENVYLSHNQSKPSLPSLSNVVSKSLKPQLPLWYSPFWSCLSASAIVSNPYVTASRWCLQLTIMEEHENTIVEAGSGSSFPIICKCTDRL